MVDLVTFGEPLILLAPTEVGLLRNVSSFRKSVVGAELNFAIGAARLGVNAGWFGRLGQDEFGADVASVLRSEGVDVSRIVYDPGAPTAVMFKEYRGFSDPSVIYYRKGSAASRLAPEDLDLGYLTSARWLHVTGITAAISKTSCEAVSRAVREAKAAGLTVSFDPNIRRKLMPLSTLHDVLLPLVDAADVLLLGTEEGELLFGVQGPEAVLRAASRRGPKTVVVKMGPEGCLATNGEDEVAEPAFPVAAVVDTVGAGDGFAAGFVAGMLRGLGFRTALRLAAMMGASAVTVRGDYEGYLTWTEACSLLGLAPHAYAR